MSYLSQKCQKVEFNDLVSELKRNENYPDFEKLVDIIQLGP